MPLPIKARGGFTYGNDALDNPATDPPLLSANVSSNLTPTLVQVTKKYIGPENETATGPNYVRQFEVDVKVAPGQTITGLKLTDVMSPGTQFLGNATIAVPPRAAASPGRRARRRTSRSRAARWSPTSTRWWATPTRTRWTRR